MYHVLSSVNIVFKEMKPLEVPGTNAWAIAG